MTITAKVAVVVLKERDLCVTQLFFYLINNSNLVRGKVLIAQLAVGLVEVRILDQLRFRPAFKNKINTLKKKMKQNCRGKAWGLHTPASEIFQSLPRLVLR